MVNWGLASRIAKDSWLINAMMSSSRTRREWRPIDAYSFGVELIKVVKLDKVVSESGIVKALIIRMGRIGRCAAHRPDRQHPPSLKKARKAID